MRQKATTNDLIVEAAFRLFNRNPGAAFGEVAEEAGIGRATLYRYFPTRETLLEEVAKTAMAELDEAIDASIQEAPSYTEGLRLAFEAMIPLADRQWFLSHATGYETPEMKARMEKDRQETKQAFIRAQSEGTFDPAIPADYLAEVYDSLLYSAWTLVREARATPSQAAEFCWRLLTKGAMK